MQSLPWHIQRTPSLISSNCITVQQAFFHSRVTVLHHLSSQCPAHLLHCVWQQQMTWKKKAEDFDHCFFLWYISWNDQPSKAHKWNEQLTWNHKSMHNLSQQTLFSLVFLLKWLDEHKWMNSSPTVTRGYTIYHNTLILMIRGKKHHFP